jgi:hypothetical protein
MKHAGDKALDPLEPVLARLRKIPGMVERSRGVFYRKSSAFLHFHEDPAGFFADVKYGDDWQRLPANSARDVTALLRKVGEILER